MERFNVVELENEDIRFMRVALSVACGGEGFVEPNPMVGAVMVRNGGVVGVGFHRYFGGFHAEVEAIADAVKNFGNDITKGATCYVTLEPCSHHGKTPPCTDAILQAGIKRVVAAMRDPNPVVKGHGIEILRANGIEVTEGILENEARNLNAPYLTPIEKKRVWIIAKWAMTLDGRLATFTGKSKWITNETSRLTVQKIRQRVDAIMIGSNTARIDDPNLTVRIEAARGFVENRVPLRIVLDSRAEIPVDSNLVRTANEIPVLVVVDQNANPENVEKLLAAGCEILELPAQICCQDVGKSVGEIVGETNETGEKNKKIYNERIVTLLEYLAQRKLTSVLVEGGQRLFGTLFDLRLIDEVNVFIAPKLIGGRDAVPVIGGIGLSEMESACQLENPKITTYENDIHIHGRLKWN
ncbi:MAG: bifunctional diaminohydroxyphosphoribosylaminopyrimidine deaminase/5-amino-6-(5-phosphoribosylamino)uracil reductase RibD [Planctomycetaceae bacterium]|jgi:diaminohydroxyphosphoribosylaminopyrimidine deaminase/5-amino-6-(5-phosphoribosylamino)uracil reductase|nr:bifunctional diaminohydroxyphosphoribosylaminopyrimidine deaminase/5-amino-6-(5-phosphoribosylamino)uracil reductase RibD [Planctomycetaceae bacterium]